MCYGELSELELNSQENRDLDQAMHESRLLRHHKAYCDCVLANKERILWHFSCFTCLHAVWVSKVGAHSGQTRVKLPLELEVIF